MNKAPPDSGTVSNGVATTRWLAENLDAGWLRVVDVRHRAVGPLRFIPGSTKLDATRVLHADGSSVSGAELAMAMSEIGVGDEHTIVLVDEGNVAVAHDVARVLRRYGHGATLVLSGGFPRWLLEKRPLAAATTRHRFASFTARMSEAAPTPRSSNRRAS
ncbi:MAG: hypothetical protein KIT84_03990 [Labilithrix sp.]|nr:hypothetical protein [Labilithrix sp.]MCW5810146.1 hypothetical protein [Labilithrix sp.]